MKNRVLILDEATIRRKLERMAYQIWEYNSHETDISLVGIEGSGGVVAAQLAAYLKKISPLQVHIHTISISKRKPLSRPIHIDTDLNGKSVVLIDDVTNSGKTLLYAMRPILDFEPASIRIAVLVDRKHKCFPVVPDIVGHSVATTLQDHIEVTCEGDRIMAAYLD